MEASTKKRGWYVPKTTTPSEQKEEVPVQKEQTVGELYQVYTRKLKELIVSLVADGNAIPDDRKIKEFLRLPKQTYTYGMVMTEFNLAIAKLRRDMEPTRRTTEVTMVENGIARVVEVSDEDDLQEAI